MQGQQQATDCNAHANKLKAHLPSKEEAVQYAALSFHSDNSNKLPSEKEINYADLDFCSRIHKPKPETLHNDVILDPLKPASQRIKIIRNNITTNTLGVNNHNTRVVTWWRKKKIGWLLGAVAVTACVSIVIIAAVIVWHGRYGISEKEKHIKKDISQKRNNVKDKFQIGNYKQGNPRKNVISQTRNTRMNVISQTGNTMENVISQTRNTRKNGISQTGNMMKNAISQTGNIRKNVVSQTGNTKKNGFCPKGNNRKQGSKGKNMLICILNILSLKT